MYYIVNLDNQVVAADSDFLSLLKINNLQELFTRLVSSELKFDESDNNTLEIVTDTNTVTLTQNRYPLSTLMGDLLLIELSEIKETASAPVDLPETTNDEVKFIIDEKEDDFVKFDSEPKEETDDEIKLIPEVESEVAFLADDKEDNFIKFDTKSEEEASKEIDLLPDEENEVAFLVEDTETTDDTINLLPDEESQFLKPAEEAVAKEEELALGESIIIDTEKISKTLGISKEDYSEFLDEFIDKAIDEEEAVKDTGSAEHHKAILSLRKLAQMLHLTALSDILEKIEKESGGKEKRAIETFYHSLSNLTTDTTQPDDTVPEPKEETYDNPICNLILDDVKPIHFDFQLEQASEDLSLPVDLIEEFVNDFIVQAHEEQETFKNACKKGDIDTIHRTGHKLKGAASNLRINPLAETLEEIQFCEDKSRFEPLLKKYWGQFLAFELYMKNISHQQGRE